MFRRWCSTTAPAALSRHAAQVPAPATPPLPNFTRSQLLAAWREVDVSSRAKLLPMISAKQTAPLTQLRAKFLSNPPKAPQGPRALFEAWKFASLEELVTVYEAAMSPIRKLTIEAEHLKLEYYGLKDHLKLGLTLFTQAQLDAKKEKLKEVESIIHKKKTEIAQISSASFSTEIFNSIINAVRIAGEQSEDSRAYGLRLFEDMVIAGVQPNAITNMLLKNITFGDGPQDDSFLLFTFCELPERGEIDLSGSDLDTSADKALEVIAKRHQTPLTPSDHPLGIKLRMAETHPLLKRLPE